MRAIRRSKKHEDLVRRFSEQAHSVSKKSIFPTIREFMCFAAALGFQSGRRTALSDERLEIDARNFENNDEAVSLMYLIGLADSKDMSILCADSEEKLAVIFEEYAETGFGKIASWVAEHASDPNGDEAVVLGMIGDKLLDGSREVARALPDITF